MTDETRKELLEDIDSDIRTLGIRFQGLKNKKARAAINKLLEVLIREKHHVDRGEDMVA